VVDYVNYWTKRAELPAKRLLGWMQLSPSKFHQWKHRYGKANEHNGQVPRDWWLEDWEKQAILDYHDRHPLEGYRSLTFMMLDDDVVAASPSSVYRVLKQAGRLDRQWQKVSKKGTGCTRRSSTSRRPTSSTGWAQSSWQSVTASWKKHGSDGAKTVNSCERLRDAPASATNANGLGGG